MYAIIRSGGKQYRVETGATITVERLDAEEGASVELSDVLMIADGDSVTSLAIFTSTFLSWPIAVILTLVLLLGRWGVDALGDATKPGIGPLVADDLFKGSRTQDPARYRVVSSSVEALSRMLNVVAAALPDINRFSATEDIERGLTIPMARVYDALAVVGCYGLSALALAYVFFRNKEVAP